MDKKQIQGLLIIGIILIGYSYFFAPSAPPPSESVESEVQQRLQDSIQTAASTNVIAIEEKTERLPDSLETAEMQNQYGMFSQFINGTSKDITLENEDVRIVLNNKGGFVKEVELKKYTTYESKPLILLDAKSSKMNIKFAHKNRVFDFDEFYFENSGQEGMVSKESKKTLVFKLQIADNKYIEQRYTLSGKGFQLQYDLQLKGLEDDINVGQNALEFSWKDNLKRLESDLKYTRQSSNVNYMYANGDFESLSESDLELQVEELITSVKWVAFKDKFFTASFMAKDKFESGVVKSVTNEHSQDIVKSFETNLYLPVDDLRQNKGNYTFFFGPNNFLTLKKVAEDFDKNIYLGWGIFGYVNRFLIIPIFNFLQDYLSNYGLIIFLLVLIIKIILFPLTFKSYFSMAKTKVLKPELEELKKKHPDDPTKVQAETMKIYKSAGVNPLGGCLPQLFQMPILFAMFTFFPNSIELRHQSFLWATDLSTYDSIVSLPFTIPFYGDHVSLFTILMTASTLLYTWFNQQMTATANAQMQFISYLMPVVFMFVLNSFPAALTYYYFLSNMITFAQMYLIKGFVDENKIRKQIEQNKLKPQKKKSFLQRKLEEAAKSKGVKLPK